MHHRFEYTQIHTEKISGNLRAFNLRKSAGTLTHFFFPTTGNLIMLG